MKRTIPLVALLAAAILVVTGLLLNGQDQASTFTTNTEAWQAYREGNRLLQSFRYAEAEARLTEALDLDPDLAMAHVALAELHRRTGKRDEGKISLAVADSLTMAFDDPRGRLLLQVRLSVMPGSRFHADADSLLAVANQTMGDELIVLVAEAGRATEAGDVEQAEAIWQRVLAINPSDASAYNFLGYLYLAQGRYDEAEAAMRRYAFVAPDLANPHDSLGDVLVVRGRYEEAEAEYWAALDKQPDFYYSLVNIGHVYLRRGEVDRANALFERVRAEMAGTYLVQDVAARYLRALFAQRLTDELSRYGAEFLQEHPDSPYSPYVRLWKHLRLEEAQPALAILDSLQAARRDTDWYARNAARRRYSDAEQLRYRGHVAELLGDHAAAASAFRQSLELVPDLPPHELLHGRLSLAWNLIPLGDLDEARQQISAVLAINPRLAEAVLAGATVAAAAAEVTEARQLITTLEQLLEQADEDLPLLKDARALRDQLPNAGQI